MTKLILLIGHIFEGSFKILPFIGPFLNIIFIIIGIAFLIFWFLKVKSLGQKDDEYQGDSY